MPTEKDKLQQIGQTFDSIGNPVTPIPMDKSQLDIQNMLDKTLDAKPDEKIGEEKGEKILTDSVEKEKNVFDKKRNTQPKQTSKATEKTDSKIGQGSKFATKEKKQFDPKTAKKKDRLTFVKGQRKESLKRSASVVDPPKAVWIPKKVVTA